MALLNSLTSKKSTLSAEISAKLRASEATAEEREADQFATRSELNVPTDGFKKSEAQLQDNAYRKWTSKYPRIASYGVGLAAAGAVLATGAAAAGLMAAGGAVLAPVTLGMLEMATAFTPFMGLAAGWIAKEKTQPVFQARAQKRRKQIKSEDSQPAEKIKSQSQKSWFKRAIDGVKNSTAGKILGRQTAKNLAILGAGVGAVELGLALGLGTAVAAAPLVIGGSLAIGVGATLGASLSTISGAINQSTDR